MNSGLPVVILGATGGIGARIAADIAAEGHPVILVARDGDRLAALASKLDGSTSYSLDLTDATSVGAFARSVSEQFGRVAAIIFSIATPFTNKLAHNSDWAVFQAQLDSQLRALHNVVRCFGDMLRGGEATSRLVVISTEYVLGAPPVKAAPYVAAKAALTAYARILAKEWLGRGVRVHIVAPGMVRTELTDHLPEAYIDTLVEAMPEKQLTTVEDVSATVRFLLTDAGDCHYGTPVRISRNARV